MPSDHIMRLDMPVLEPEDGLLLGNGDLSVSVYQTRDQLRFRFGKCDVWDRRFDSSDDPAPPTIEEIAHGIRDEGWKCPPYGDAEPIALKGTDNPERMKELCSGTPASYTKRPYPCPKPTGELAVQLPPDLPGLKIVQELNIESSNLTITCTSSLGVTIIFEGVIPPDENVFALTWRLENWTDETKLGNGRPPLWFMLYRWADPTILEFGQKFFAQYRHGEFLSFDMDKSTPLPHPSIRAVSGKQVIEQTFPADPTFPRGFWYQMAPFGENLTAENIDMGTTGEARLHLFTSGNWLAVAIPTASDAENSEAIITSLQQRLDNNATGVIDTWKQTSLNEARSFWHRAAVDISDPLLENLWYETYHARRCTYKDGKTPPGLFLPSTVQDYSHWHGDYHTNYNYQQPFWGDYTANQLGLGDSYFTGMQYFLQMGRIIAEKYYKTRGVFIQLSGYPILALDDVLGAVPMGRMAYMTGWAANHYWERYRFTLDDEWLRDEGYPVIRDCALFYLDMLEKGEDGLYHFFPSNQGEEGFTGSTSDYTDRAQVMDHLRYCLRIAIDAAKVLNTDEDLQLHWQDRLDNCAGNQGAPPEKFEGLLAHFRNASPPEKGATNPPHPPLPETLNAPWPGPGNWTDLWYAGQYPLIGMPTLRSQNLDGRRAYDGLYRIVQRWRHPNGLIWAMSRTDYGASGAWAETLGICAPLQEMILQSVGGVIHLFPVWPGDVAASFTTFRAEGAFLVSAEWNAGEVISCRITSEKGALCRIYNPWQGRRPVVKDNLGNPVTCEQWQGDIWEFATTTGVSYQVSSE